MKGPTRGLLVLADLGGAAAGWRAKRSSKRCCSQQREARSVLPNHRGVRPTAKSHRRDAGLLRAHLLRALVAARKS